MPHHRRRWPVPGRQVFFEEPVVVSRCFLNWSKIYLSLWMPLAWPLIASGAVAADVVVVEPGDDLQGVIIRGRSAPRPFVVELAAGRHELSRPLILTEADSGLTLRGPPSSVRWRSRSGRPFLDAWVCLRLRCLRGSMNGRRDPSGCRTADWSPTGHDCRLPVSRARRLCH